MENEKNFDKQGIFSKRVRAGKRRTYFFDVRETKGSDYYITITESKKRFNEENYDRHKIFIYKEDFIKFVNAMQETIDFIKKELLPDYDFNAHSHENDDEDRGEYRSNYRQQDKDQEKKEEAYTHAKSEEIEESTEEPEEMKMEEPEPEEEKTETKEEEKEKPSTIVPPTVDDIDKWD